MTPAGGTGPPSERCSLTDYALVTITPQHAAADGAGVRRPGPWTRLADH